MLKSAKIEKFYLYEEELKLSLNQSFERSSKWSSKSKRFHEAFSLKYFSNNWKASRELVNFREEELCFQVFPSNENNFLFVLKKEKLEIKKKVEKKNKLVMQVP